MPWLRVWALPVLPVSWSFTHWMELSPSWVDEDSWLRSPLSASCSPSWVTWAMAGMAATASIAKSAANSINFFIFSYLPLWNLTNLHIYDRTPPPQAPSSKRMVLADQKDDFGATRESPDHS